MDFDDIQNMCAHTYSTQRYTQEQAYAHYIQSTQNSLPKA